MSVTTTSWVLTEAPVNNPTEAMVLVVMAERTDQNGRGCYYSHRTLAAYARVSVSTVQRTLRTLEERGLIVRGDQQTVAHIPERHRPVVWDIPLPARSVRLTDQPESDRSDEPIRSVRTPESDRSPVTDNPSTNPTDKTYDWTPAQQTAFTSGQPVGCRTHGVRRPACDACMRTSVGLDRVQPADSHKGAQEARKSMRGAS